MIEFAQQWAGGLLTFALSAIGCALFEFLAPAERQSWRSYTRALVFWSIFLAAAAAVLVPTQALIRYAGWAPLFSLDLGSALDNQPWFILAAAYVLLPFAPYLLFDCFYYWFHRLQHAVPFLWRFHAVHHSIEELNAANCYHHATEGFFRLPFVVLPLTLVIELKVPDIFIMTAVLAAWGQFVHANTRISLGPLNYLLAGPRYHRVHHSLAVEHHDKNFASFFPVFDALFGTAYFPKPDETIKTGLCDRREPQTTKQYLFTLAPREEQQLHDGRRRTKTKVCSSV